jgi:hypothetical protein
VAIIEPLLRQEEVREALNEFYRACRIELESRGSQYGVLPSAGEPKRTRG